MVRLLDRLEPPIPGDGDINLPFIIGLSSSLSFILLVILILAVYYIFFNDSLPLQDSSNNVLSMPDYSSTMEEIARNEALHLKDLSETDKFYYLMGKSFQNRYKPSLASTHASDLDAQLLISNRGIRAYYFEPYVDQLTELAADEGLESTPLINNNLLQQSYGTLIREDIPYIVEENTEISFLTSNPASAILNYPVPVRNRHNDTVYFEVKLFDFNPETTKVNLGLAAKPHPNFRLPGEFFYSFGLESTGHFRMNKPLCKPDDNPVLTSQIVQGDVIGIGYKSQSGTVFLTHNGKKLGEVIKNLRSDLYPCIGSVGGPSKILVNLGQSGFVFIEANVQKLGFCENNNDGNLGAPPLYKREKKSRKTHNNNNNNNSTSSSSDIVLDRGEALPPDYPEEEVTFFGPKALLEAQNVSTDEKSKPLNDFNEKISSKPPSYRSDTPSSKGSRNSEKVSKIVSSKLQKQQQVPDSLLHLNERLYEHSTSQFDQEENLNEHQHTDGLDIEEENVQSLLLAEASNNTDSTTTDPTLDNVGSSTTSNSTPDPVDADTKEDESTPKPSSASILRKSNSPPLLESREGSPLSSKKKNLSHRKKKKKAKKNRKRNW